MLVLPIKKKWFDMIKSGEKKEEYREIKPYWEIRFKNNLDNPIISLEGYLFHAKGNVIFKNGYSKDSPKIKCNIELHQGFGNIEWGADPHKLYYVLKILSVEEVN